MSMSSPGTVRKNQKRLSQVFVTEAMEIKYTIF